MHYNNIVQDSTGDIWKVTKVFPKVARRFKKKKSLKGSEKSLNLATKSLSWQHCIQYALCEGFPPLFISFVARSSVPSLTVSARAWSRCT